MRLPLVSCTCIQLVMGAALAAPAMGAEAGFAAKPAAEKVDEGVRIRFAAAAATDAEVAIVDAKGNIVRHLAAGVLGKNAPAPLKKGSLAQALLWDGRDDAGRQVLSSSKGKVAAAGLRARVRLGLRAVRDGSVFAARSGPDGLTNVIGLAAGPKGRVYVLSQRWRRGHWGATSVHVFGRDGRYAKTIKPFPADLPPARVAAITKLADAAGRPVPTIYRVIAMSFYPKEDLPQQPAVSPDGNLHLVVTRAAYVKGPGKSLATIGPDGGIPYDDYTGGRLPSRYPAGRVHLASSADGKAVFATGLERIGNNPRHANKPVVWKIALPDRDAAVFFGGDESGKGPAALSDPRGLAVDGKGRLFVADRGNDRVLVLNERDGRPLGSLAVDAPDWIGVHRGTGAVYVRSGREVVKFAGWKQPKAVARLKLPAMPERLRAATQWYFALDAQAEPAVLWIGRSRGEPALFRAEDRGRSFGAPAAAGCHVAPLLWNLTAGLDRREIACKTGNYTLAILDEATGKTRRLRPTGSHGQTYRIGPRGQIYGIDHSGGGIRRWDRSGKPLPFPATVKDAKLRGRLASAPSGTTSWERDFGVDARGHVFVKQRGKVYHGRMRVDEFDADGRFQRTVIWVVSDGALGPKIDRAGNLYVAECIKPVGRRFPDYFAGKLPKVRADRAGVTQQYTWMYGSIIKFSPKGGAVWFPRRDPDEVYAFDGPAKLPPGLPTEKIDTAPGTGWTARPGKLQGAMWWRFGCSFLLDMQPGHSRRCHCTGTDFEVDGFGRVFYPDQGRFRLEVLDANGNAVTRFGRYGNQDAGDDDLAFAWIIGVAVSDRYVYIADGLNRRVIRARLVCAAEADCSLPAP